MNVIRIVGARQHNLKNINIDVPRGKFVVVTGVSGSGKSSLAFDTIFAEGQRRYMESLSSYARQFVEKMDKPDVDSIEGLSPSVSVDQKSFLRNPRSTVGTITEIYDFLRLLFARLGTPYCYRCGSTIQPQRVEGMVKRVLQLGEGQRASVFSPIVRGRKGQYKKELEELRAQGFLRVKIDGELYDLDEEIDIDRQKKHTIELLVDVIVLKGAPSASRVDESLRLALKRSGGTVRVESSGGDDITFSEKFACTNCDVSYPEISPRLFSFNSPYGACRNCQGLGTSSYFDPELIVESWDKSIDQGAIIPWRNSTYFKRVIDAVSRHFDFDLSTPLKKLPKRIRMVLMHGSGSEAVTFSYQTARYKDTYTDTFPGIVGILTQWYEETDSREVRETLGKYMRTDVCPECRGSRLRKESMSVRVGGKSIYDISVMDVARCGQFFKGLRFEGTAAEVAGRVLKEIRSRLEFLEGVGLSYLTLERAAPTLSGGEAQRIRLATQVGSKLTGVTYVLDEPTIGLHPRDNKMLIDTLYALRDSGNSVIVVEHDADTIRSADYVLDLGPGAGELGGEVVSMGTVSEIIRDENSLTGRYLSGALSIPVTCPRRSPEGYLTVKRASGNNLKGMDVSIPLGLFTCVTGVSGSGKSTLIVDTLYAELANRLYGAKRKVCGHSGIVGAQEIDKVINVDQSPIGRTPRSNPATYTGIFTPLRQLFAMLPTSKMRGYNPGRFSFNVEAGRCAGCRGDGVKKIEMHFLSDVYVRCEECGAKRYNSETLEVRYKGKSIADVLDMTVSEACVFFENVPHLRSKLEMLRNVGLDYVRLGQPATTLSGGEAQRIKLGKELSKRSTGKTLYILDEPTIGLHFDDVLKLLGVIERMRDLGNTVVVIEHNVEVIKTADYVIDLGPEGGEDGGRVIACGTPEEVARTEGSYTGMFLRRVLDCRADTRN